MPAFAWADGNHTDEKETPGFGYDTYDTGPESSVRTFPLPDFGAMPARRPLIVIDPGHGVDRGRVRDHGASSPHAALTELDVIDPVAERLGAKLSAAGYDVAFTRAPYQYMKDTSSYKINGNTLSDRQVRPHIAHSLADAENYRNVYFISLHANIYPQNDKINGALVLAGAESNGNGVVDFGGPALNRDSYDFARTLAQNLTIHGSPAVYTTSDATVINRFDKRGNGAPGRAGIRAGALVELGYLTNKGDVARLKEMAQNPEAVAAQLMEGILRYHESALRYANSSPMPEKDDASRAPDPPVTG